MFKLSKEDKKGIILISVAFIIMLALAIAYFMLSEKKGSYNKKTLCPKNIEYLTNLYLIDKSDRWSKKDSQKIIDLIEKKVDNLEQYERLIIKVIEPSEDSNSTEPSIKTYFDMCNPGNKANPLYENPKKIMKKYRQSFKEPLENILNTLTSPTETKASPILNTISESLYDIPYKANIYLISDLLEYDEFNFYQQIPTAQQVINYYDFPKNKINIFETLYILRDGYTNKINNALKFYKQFANNLNAKFQKRRLMRVKAKRRVFFAKNLSNLSANSLEVIPHERLRFLCKSIDTTIADVTINKKYKQNLSSKKTFIFLSKGNFDLIVNGKKYRYNTDKKMYFVIESGQIKPIKASYFRNPN